MSKNLDDLRSTLFATIEAVRAGQMQLDTAKTINEIGKTIVDTAKVEVDYIRAIDGEGKSSFIPAAPQRPQLPSAPAANGIDAMAKQITNNNGGQQA